MHARNSVFNTSVAQLAEQRSPKPQVAGSWPARRATIDNDLTEENKMLAFESFETSGWFIMSPIGINIGGRVFQSKKDAQDFQKKFKHSLTFKKAKIVEGSVDMHGFVTPYR